MNKKILAFAGGIGSVLLNMPVVLAQGGGISQIKPDFLGSTDSVSVIKNILNLLLFVVIIAAVVYITLAGIKYITSSGDAAKAKEAQAAITNAVIGIIVAFAAYFVVTIVLGQLGVKQDSIPVPTGTEVIRMLV